jgi:predicted transcriptional regulator
MLLKHANYKTGECYPRLSTIAKPLGLSKVTVYKCINIMIKGGILLKVRLPSTNLYKINPEFVYSDIKTVKGGIKTVNGDVKTVKVLVEHNIEHYIEQSIEAINNIINNNRGNKDTIVYLISRSIPLPELNNLLIQNIHTYYVRLAIDKHRELLRQKNLMPEAVAKTQISQALKNNSKQRSASYKAKVEFNKRNNLDWQGKPKQ